MHCCDQAACVNLYVVLYLYNDCDFTVLFLSAAGIYSIFPYINIDKHIYGYILSLMWLYVFDLLEKNKDKLK